MNKNHIIIGFLSILSVFLISLSCYLFYQADKFDKKAFNLQVELLTAKENIESQAKEISNQDQFIGLSVTVTNKIENLFTRTAHILTSYDELVRTECLYNTSGPFLRSYGQIESAWYQVSSEYEDLIKILGDQIR